MTAKEEEEEVRRRQEQKARESYIRYEDVAATDAREEEAIQTLRQDIAEVANGSLYYHVQPLVKIEGICEL